MQIRKPKYKKHHVVYYSRCCSSPLSLEVELFKLSLTDVIGRTCSWFEARLSMSILIPLEN
jgi:hypothetical protein